MDDWGIDLIVTGCQKGLMTPPGLSYCLIGEKSLAKSMKIEQVSPYWDWKPRVKPKIFYERFFGTAPTHLLFAQRAALDIIMEEGREGVFKRHRVFAEALWAAIKKWEEAGSILCNIKNKNNRSKAVTTVTAKGYNLTILRNWLKENSGLELGVGIGFESEKYMNGDSVFRIAHMGHMNPTMLLSVIASIEMGFLACGVPYRPGGTTAASKVMIKALR
jgi:alanine-glyoxylate transaminase/serine-glyoxylate transaminase/serine-pyruvate transaminase